MNIPIFAAFLVVVFPSLLVSATLTWSGTVSPGWSNGANWAGGIAPSPGDDLVFGNTAGTHQPVNDFPAGTQFHSLTFDATGGVGDSTATGYSITGNSIVLTGGITAQGPVGIGIALPVTVGAPQTWQSLNGGLTIGTVDLGANTLTLKSSTALVLNGPVAGSGGLSIAGAPGSGFNASSAVNTYTGQTTVGGGVFVCDGCTIPGPVSVSGGVFEFSNGSGIPTTGPLTSTGGSIYVDTTSAVNGDFTLSSSTGFRTFGATLSVHGAVSLGNSLLSYQPGVLLAPGQSITIIDNDGSDSVNGTFAGLPEGAMVSNGIRISYRGGTGNDVTLTHAASSTTTLISSPNPSTPGQAVTLTATVTSSGGSPSGTVTFYDGATSLGTQPLASGQATMNTSSLAPGTHDLTATFTPSTYAFDGSTSSDVVQTVTSAGTSTSLTASPNPTLVGNTTTLTATVTSSAGTPTGSVTFYDDTTVLATQTLSSGTAVVTVGPLSRGDHMLNAQFVSSTATFSGSTSPVVRLTVAVPVATFTMLDISADKIKVGEPVTMTATVSAASGTPVGIVTFFDGDTLLDTEAIGGGTASFTISTLAAGEHHLVAVFTSPTLLFQPSSSNVVVLEVTARERRRPVRH